MALIMHVDMNSYFASCEQQDNPAWRGKPLGVCEHLGGIIIAPSKEAKKFGVKTAMPVWDAKKLCPQIILTPTSPDRYRYYTKKFLIVLSDYTDKLEKYSIDEAFLDVTRSATVNRLSKNGLEPIDPYEEAKNIALEIKQRIKAEVGDWLTCSVGIGWNKLVAKIGSDMQKPDGLTIIRPEDKERLYDQLQLSDIPGIGYRTVRRLAAMQVLTLRDLSKYPRSHLVTKFGIPGYHLYSAGQLEGSFKEDLSIETEAKSMGHMYTVPKEYRAKTSAPALVQRLVDMVARRLRAHEVLGQSIFAHVHYTDNTCLSGNARLPEATAQNNLLYDYAKAILIKQSKDYATRGGILKVGVTVGDLIHASQQLSLFPQDNRKMNLDKALDKVTNKHGQYAITFAGSMKAKELFRDSIGFGRMKEFTRENFGRNK
jgi:DNA polymerase-4